MISVAPKARFTLLALLLGCSAATPPRPDVGWYERAFGHPANVAAVVRVRDILLDPYYGPYVRHAFANLDAKSDAVSRVLGHIEEVDVAMAVTTHTHSDDVDALAVFYGVTDDPASLRDGSRNVFDAPTRLPSGVLEYVPLRTSDRDFSLFVVPGAWVVAHGTAIPRARVVLSESASAPPRLGLEPSALAVLSVHGTIFDSGELSARQLDGPARVVAESLDVGETFITRSATGDVVTRMWFTNEDAAKVMEGEMRDVMAPDSQCDSTCKLVRALLVSLVDVERNGAFFSVRIHVPEVLLHKLTD
jgi:hypothetical protein